MTANDKTLSHARAAIKESNELIKGHDRYLEEVGVSYKTRLGLAALSTDQLLEELQKEYPDINVRELWESFEQ